MRDHLRLRRVGVVQREICARLARARRIAKPSRYTTPCRKYTRAVRSEPTGHLELPMSVRPSLLVHEGDREIRVRHGAREPAPSPVGNTVRRAGNRPTPGTASRAACAVVRSHSVRDAALPEPGLSVSFGAITYPARKPTVRATNVADDERAGSSLDRQVSPSGLRHRGIGLASGALAGTRSSPGGATVSSGTESAGPSSPTRAAHPVLRSRAARTGRLRPCGDLDLRLGRLLLGERWPSYQRSIRPRIIRCRLRSPGSKRRGCGTTERAASPPGAPTGPA